MGLLLLYLSISLFLSFLCSLLEASLLSVTPAHATVVSQQNPSLGKDLQHFKDNIDRPLAAILTLNTFAHTIGAAGVGVQAQKLWGEEYLTLVSVLLTIVILLLTEIVPKTLGANYWKQLTPFTVRLLKIIIFSPLYPIIVLSQFITRRLKTDKERSILSRADFTAMAELGSKEGILLKGESRIIQNLLHFNNIQVHHIMTPRTVINAAQEDQSIATFFNQATSLRHSRIPVYSTTVDNITGYVLKDDVMQKIIQQQGHLPLKSIKRNIQAVHEHMPTPVLFNNLMKNKDHIAIVVDEYGGTAGIVSMEDVIETLLGTEIMDEMDDVADLQQWARSKWDKRAQRFGNNIDRDEPEE